MFISAATNTFDKRVKVQNLRGSSLSNVSSKRSLILAITSSTTKRRYKRGKKGRERGRGGKEGIEKTNVARSLGSPELGFRCSRKLGLFI